MMPTKTADFVLEKFDREQSRSSTGTMTWQVSKNSEQLIREQIWKLILSEKISEKTLELYRRVTHLGPSHYTDRLSIYSSLSRDDPAYVYWRDVYRLIQTWDQVPKQPKENVLENLRRNQKEAIRRAEDYHAQFGNPVDNLSRMLESLADESTWRTILDEPYK